MNKRKSIEGKKRPYNQSHNIHTHQILIRVVESLSLRSVKVAYIALSPHFFVLLSLTLNFVLGSSVRLARHAPIKIPQTEWPNCKSHQENAIHKIRLLRSPTCIYWIHVTYHLMYMSFVLARMQRLININIKNKFT